MNNTIKNLFLSWVGMFWILLDDFEPKHTIDEATLFVNDLRSEMFDREDEELRTRMVAQLVATREAHKILIQNNGPEDMINVLSERISVLDNILTPVLRERDIFAGSLSEETALKADWQRTDDQPTTLSFLAGQGKKVVGRLLEDRELHEETVQLRTRIRVYKQALLEVQHLVPPENRQVIETRLAALEAAEQAIPGQRYAKTATQIGAANVTKGPRYPNRTEGQTTRNRSARGREEIFIKSFEDDAPQRVDAD